MFHCVSYSFLGARRKKVDKEFSDVGSESSPVRSESARRRGGEVQQHHPPSSLRGSNPYMRSLPRTAWGPSPRKEPSGRELYTDDTAEAVKAGGVEAEPGPSHVPESPRKPDPELLARLEHAIAERAVLLDGLNSENSHSKKLEQKLRSLQKQLQLSEFENQKFKQRIAALDRQQKKLKDDERAAVEAEDQLAVRNAEYQQLRWEYNAVESEIKTRDSSRMVGKKKLEHELRQLRSKSQQRQTVAYDKKIAALKKEIADLESQLEELKTSDRPPSVVRHKKQLEMAQELAEIEEKLTEKRKQELERLQQEIANKDREAIKAAEEMEERERKAKAEFQAKMANIELTRQAKSKDSVDLKAVLEHNKKETAANVALIKQKKGELEALKQELSSKQEELAADESILRGLHKQVEEALKGPKNALQDMHALAWEKEKAELQKNLDSQKARLADLKKEKVAAQTRLKERKEAAEAAKGKNQETLKQNQASSAEAAQLEKDIAAAEKTLSGLDIQLEDVKGKIEASQKPKIIAKLERDNAASDKEFSELTQSNKELSERVAALAAKLKAAGVSIDE